MPDEPISEETVEEWKKTIPLMSHEDMARLWRFAPSGHPVFLRDLPLFDLFMERFRSFGAMTPEMSKIIGWKEGGGA